MEEIRKKLLKEIADLENYPKGAYNIRVNGKTEKRNSTKDISIETKKNLDGIDIKIRDGVKGQSVHIPVIISETGLKEVVYNDFFVGENCDVLIVAGCGINCNKNGESQHSGVHTFHVGKNSNVRYVEKHIGMGEIKAKKNMNPTTIVVLEEGATMTMETTQIFGIDKSNRVTKVIVNKNASLIVKESICTNLKQQCETNFNVELVGENSKVNIVSRSVASNNSKLTFNSRIVGKEKCFGHVECDSIIQDGAIVTSVPALVAGDNEANLVHEAVIGKLAPEQVIKLMTLGLTEQEATETIIAGFLN